MPPSDEILTSDQLWAQIMAMPRPHRVVDFPRKGPDGQPMGRLAMFVLTQEENERAIASAEAFVRRILKDQKSMPTSGEPRTSYEDMIESRRALEVLFRSCKQPENLEKGFFPAVESIAARLTVDEVAVLVLNYNRVKSELGPVDSEMGPEERDAWIEKLAKGGSMFPFDSLSMGAQSALILYMANRLWSSRTDSSTPGSPPDGNTSS